VRASRDDHQRHSKLQNGKLDDDVFEDDEADGRSNSQATSQNKPQTKSFVDFGFPCRRMKRSRPLCYLFLVRITLGLSFRTRLPPLPGSRPSAVGHADGHAVGHLPRQLHIRHATSAANNEANPVNPVNEIGIGIDLGTTNSAVAYVKDGVPTIIPIPGDGRTMPSLVSLVDPGTRAVVGKEALAQAQQPYSHVKRVLGTGGKIARDVARVVPYLVRSQQGKTFKKNSLDNQLHDARHFPTLLRSSIDRDETIRPEEISTHIVQKLKEAAEEHTGCRVTRAVVGVPAYFNDANRQSTIDAVKAAGIDKVKLLREPEAAALAYGAGKEQVGRGDDDELVLAFDLGGGTFDVSMMVVGGGVSEIISTSGDVCLGGSNFDERIAQFLRRLLMSHGVNVKKFSAQAQIAMLQSAEQLRIFLSNNRKANFALPLTQTEWIGMRSASDVLLPLDSDQMTDDKIEKGVNNSTHVLCQLTRRSMERLCKDELQALLRPVREVAIMAGALLPGDTSPTLVDAALELEEMGKADGEDDSMLFGDFYDQDSGNIKEEEINDEILLQLQDAALKGAKRAQQKGRKRARDLSKEEKKFRQEKKRVATASPGAMVDGLKVQDGITGRPISRVVLVGGATRMHAVGRLIGELTGVVPQKTVNPDEAVALGCAANVGILDGMEGMGRVLSPMQAAILRAVAEQEGMFQDDFDDEEFDEAEYF
jgi:molecular chaperone DnaK (HSP70)